MVSPFNFFKKGTCKHRFKKLETIQYEYLPLDGSAGISIPIDLYECIRCGKRRVRRAPFFLYSPYTLEKIEKWINKEIDLEDI